VCRVTDQWGNRIVLVCQRVGNWNNWSRFHTMERVW
jgi:hypothetical protein